MTRTVTRPGLVPPKPKVKVQSNVYTVLLVIAFLFVTAAVVFNELDLVGRYHVEVMKTILPF